MAQEREPTIGCAGYLAIGVFAMLICGYFGFKIGESFASPTGDGTLAGQIGMLAGIDARCVTAMAYGRST